MDFLRSNKHAQWLVPVGLGLFSCVCSCGVMFCLFATVVMPVDTAGLPPDKAFAYGMQLGQRANASQQLYTLSMYCVPPLLLVVVGIAAFLFMRNYQKRAVPTTVPGIVEGQIAHKDDPPAV